MTTRNLARVGGLLYLADAITGGFAEYVRSSNTVAGDAAATGANVAGHSILFRLAFAADLADLPLFLGVGIILFVIFRPVNPPVAIAMLALNAISIPMQGMNMLNQAGAMLAATDPHTTGQVLFFLNLHRVGYLIAQIFFGSYLLPLGYLVYRSELMPKVIGWVLVAGGTGYLAGIAFAVAAPGFESSLATPLGLAGGLAELTFLLWLLIRGVATPRQVALGVAA